MPKIEDENSFFVPVRDTVELRKNLLGGVKKTLIMLKRYERFRLLREEKAKRIHELRILVKELDFLNKKLQNTLPKTHLRGQEKVIEKQQVQVDKRQPKKTISELDKLEYELQSIESKLRNLDR